jgi:molybdenum cofactor cytidylyltransferase
MKPTLQHPEMACLLLAAGTATRFGGGKLTFPLGGDYLGVHAARTLAAIRFGNAVAVCNPADQELCDAYNNLGFEIVANQHPENGQSESLRLGLAVLNVKKPAGIMIALADMPFITAEHINGLMASFKLNNELLAVASFNGTARLPPVILPPSVYVDLGGLAGDFGARNILKDALQIVGNRHMLADIDRREDLPGQAASGFGS